MTGSEEQSPDRTFRRTLVGLKLFQLVEAGLQVGLSDEPLWG